MHWVWICLTQFLSLWSKWIFLIMILSVLRKRCKFYLLILKCSQIVKCGYKRGRRFRGTISIQIQCFSSDYLHFHILIISSCHGNKVHLVFSLDFLFFFCYQNKSPQFQSFEFHQFSASQSYEIFTFLERITTKCLWVDGWCLSNDWSHQSTFPRCLLLHAIISK